MKENSGIEASLTEDDVQAYMCEYGYESNSKSVRNNDDFNI